MKYTAFVFILFVLSLAMVYFHYDATHVKWVLEVIGIIMGLGSTFALGLLFIIDGIRGNNFKESETEW